MGLYLTLFAFGLSDLWIYFLVAVALGMVIFVHELGHFAVAKLCGVKCEKFYLGFDIGGLKLARFKWGETEYGIGIVPLGGYVKMLGQEDNPGRLQEEIERSRVQPSAEVPTKDTPAHAHHFTESELREAEQALHDPRSYLAKSVPQRMAIISAGVVMNMIFAFLAAVMAYWYGVYQVACGVGEVAPGQSAWTKGLRPGDEIVKIAGKPSPLFQDLMAGVSLGDLEKGVSLEIQRPGVAQTFTILVHPDRLTGKPTIGIAPPRTNALYPEGMPVMPGSSASKAQPEFVKGDRIVAIDGQPVESFAQLETQLVLHPEKTLEFTVMRTPEGKNQPADKKPDEQVLVRVGPNPIQHLGLVMGMGDITAIQEGSPAEKAGFKRGDRIESINGKPVGDPMTLPARWRSREGSAVIVSVLRETSKQPVEIPVTLRKVDWLDRPLSRSNPMPFPALGVTYEVLNRIQSVEAGSPAAEAGVKPGEVIAYAEILPPPELPPGAAEMGFGSTVKFEFGEKNRNWPTFFSILQSSFPGSLPGSKVKLTLENKSTFTLTPVASKDQFNPDRGLLLDAKQVKVVAQTFNDALTLGGQQTVESATLVYSILRKLGTQISPRQLSGPVDIFRTAMYAAREGVPKLLLFLTMLSANLAVINFLPIPVLDGGHMVFLIWEGIVGKPVSERVQVALTYAGLIFILSLMVFVLGLDFRLIPRQ